MKLHTISGKAFLASLLIILGGSVSFAQTRHSVKGVVKDEKGTPMEFASCVLSGGKAVATGAESAADGSFSISVPEGRYRFEASFIGYEKYVDSISVLSDMFLDTIRLKPLGKALTGAVVTASAIKYNSNGYTMNVKDYQAVQMMQLNDIINTSPGLMVTDNGIRAYGNLVDAIYVDGRKQKISKSEITSFLRQFNGRDIKSIELVENAGADTDASSMGQSILKIVTIKEEGLSLSLTGGVSFNKWLFSCMPGLNMTYNHGGLSLYTRISPSFVSSSDSSFYKNEYISSGLFSQKTQRGRRLSGPSISDWVTGMNYRFSKSDELSVEGEFRGNNRDVKSFMDVSPLSGPSYLESVKSGFTSRLGSASILYVHQTRRGGELRLSTDYYASRTSKSSIDSIPPSIADSYLLVQKSDENARSMDFQLNYTVSFIPRKDKFACGASFSSLFDRSSFYNSTTALSKGLTESKSGFDYDEKIASAFSSYQVNLGNFFISGGFAVDYSMVNGSNQLNCLPNLKGTYYIDKRKGNSLNLSYGHQISRPSMANLNPNPVLIEQDYYSVGNPDLKVVQSDNFGFGLKFLNKYSLNLSYSFSNNSVTNRYYQDELGRSFVTPINASSNKFIAANVTAPFSIAKWWNLNLMFQYSYGRSSYENLTSTNNYFVGYATSMFILPHSWMVNLQCNGGTPIQAGINYKISMPFVASLGVSKTMLKGKLNLAATIFDIFDSSRRSSIYTTDAVIVTSKILKSTRTLQLRLTYNFQWGKRKDVNVGISDGSSIKSRLSM